MSGSTSLGRLSAAEAGKPVIYDSPNKVISALLNNQDALIAVIQALAAQLDAGSVAGGPYVPTAASLAKISLTE